LIRVLLDQGCPRSAAAILNQHGWDVAHVADLGLSRATDVEILDVAKSQNRVCVTLDADFHTHLAVTNAAAPSTIRIRIEGLKADALANLLMEIWPMIADQLKGRAAMVTITEAGVRLRSLPIVP
jgi:predicted nuclease of predicted toxin-antitoxin system